MSEVTTCYICKNELPINKDGWAEGVILTTFKKDGIFSRVGPTIEKPIFCKPCLAVAIEQAQAARQQRLDSRELVDLLASERGDG